MIKPPQLTNFSYQDTLDIRNRTSWYYYINELDYYDLLAKVETVTGHFGRAIRGASLVNKE